MARFIKMRLGSKGTKPGSLIFLGDKKTEQVTVNVMRFDRIELEEKIEVSIDDALAMIDDQHMTWINIFGLHDTGIMSKIGELLHVDELTLEDMLNTDQRSRFAYQEDEQQLLFIVKLLSQTTDNMRIESDQLSIIAGRNYVVTLQERPGNHFDAVRERIRKSKDRIRIIYPDYLAFALLDCMVDTYMDIIANLGGTIDALEEEILNDAGKETSGKIYRLRTELNYMRRIVLPLKETTLGFLKSNSPLIREDTRPFMTDLYDHVILTFESVEVYYSLVADQLDIYNSTISNRANEIMKVLTVFAAIFIPLTFIAGIYGMNFKKIPELEMNYGYLYFWILILLVAIGLVIYFRRKKWL
jgi:magnesium transporter